MKAQVNFIFTLIISINIYRQDKDSKEKLVAMVHFNREELELKLKTVKAGLTQKMDEKIEEISHRVDEKFIFPARMRNHGDV